MDFTDHYFHWVNMDNGFHAQWDASKYIGASLSTPFVWGG